ncbi:hypothetical protein MYCTH_2310956 [Thermothelomyces thermophilus ATCC 42464]|uniref:Uncharacterized protein n=1 Tax=Thermothelomyces thermophilus (strain ATCC 42464 / BCRC 31852 / DSM 1799) TaxID=573729 RepID=G2QMB3_THET4|nr:uncharacterized protein MYCTH_2310956 [Thermothelomyces thermophilus ATCC 42464]AEO61093.1 hypothetical protein MYCTH_2310956 [Thermothelomyces thermophilus ATCC 42464]
MCARTGHFRFPGFGLALPVPGLLRVSPTIGAFPRSYASSLGVVYLVVTNVIARNAVVQDGSGALWLLWTLCFGGAPGWPWRVFFLHHGYS